MKKRKIILFSILNIYYKSKTPKLIVLMIKNNHFHVVNVSDCQLFITQICSTKILLTLCHIVINVDIK